MGAQGAAGYGHPVRTLVPVIPLSGLVDRGVVKETAPNRPVHARQALFLTHGDIWPFRAAFLTGAHPLPVFLAQNGVDVWGIDFRSTLVPATVTDLSFMKT